jgi:hypothetical protein
MRTDGAARMGGWALIVAAAGFVAVFSYLAAQFGYPDVLEGSGPDVLPRLLELGETGRAVWVVYALLPLLLIPAAAGTYAALRDAAPTAMRVACTFAVVAAVSMFLGLARWPSVHWELARAYGPASPEARVAIDAVFSGLNVYLGNFVGEFLGELSLNAFFILTAVALLRTGRRWTAYGGFAAGGLGLIAALRNVTPAVDLVAAADNYVLPLWLVVLGAVLARWRGADSLSS